MPCVDKTKIPTARAGSAVALMGPAPQANNANDIGAFRTVCQFSHMAFDDPIVFPGQSGASHLHTFFGNSGTNANSTYASLFGGGNSTCGGGTMNRSAYWAPTMIDTRTGTPVVPSTLLTYYKTGYAGVRPASVQAIPEGLRIVAGDSKATSEPSNGPVQFICLSTLAQTRSIPACGVGDQMWSWVVFPQCWDGVNLDSPDHKSHMAYPSNGCPASHPVALPEITVIVQYIIGPNDAPNKWRLSSDNYDASKPGGYSAHADWFGAWNRDVMATWIKNCDQASTDCHVNLLGNGSWLVNPAN